MGVTGSVAAIKVPELHSLLKIAGHRVKIVATDAALYFFDPAALDPVDARRPQRNPEVVVLDTDEWPGRDEGRRYRRGDDVLHIELRRWAELFLIAPLDANTLAKLALGLADNCLTCVWRAWDPSRPAVLAPAMNTLMWQHPATARHLIQIAEDAGLSGLTRVLTAEDVVAEVNARSAAIRVVAPESRQLACGDVGVGALATPDRIVAVVDEQLRRDTANP
jgi:phosphopantothenoylcysteine decarboxylase